ncbi:MAG: acetoin utilization protein AcuC [Desulfosarcinaceae bacterium]|nr:acetoin utilization protein AcuC [Desulfosarcinaceae bacterium]
MQPPRNRHHARLFTSPLYRGHHFGGRHPLGIPRVSLTEDLIRLYDALTPDQHCESRVATFDELTLAHTPEYIEALQRSEARGSITWGDGKRFNLGNFENPFFPKIFTIPATAAGASIQAAEAVLDGEVAFNPAGGMHHAMPARARGFCYLNDAVMALHRLCEAGWRVLYLDLDAHHGDGVEAAFTDSDQVLTVSLHMDTSYAYPRRGGRITDTGAAGHAVNLPLPKGTHDAEYRLCFATLWPRLLEAFKPDALVMQAGADTLAADPLGKFKISTDLFLEVVAGVFHSAPRHIDQTEAGRPAGRRLLVLGGGGYHPLSLARAWTGVWALLSHQKLPRSIPPMARQLLTGVLDESEAQRAEDGGLLAARSESLPPAPIRDDVRERLDLLLSTHPLLRN